MDFIDNKVANRLGGISFFKNSDNLYKFEKVKKITKEVQSKNPNLKLIDMGVGEPDKMADISIVDILSIEAQKPENRFYADNGIIEFQEAACRYLDKVYGIKNINPANIVHGIGSKPVLAMLPICFINPGDICLMPSPAYQVLGTYSKFLGGEIYKLPLCAENNFYPDLDSIPSEIRKKAKLLYLNYPNNPTGQVATKKFFEYAVKFARDNDILIISDLAYGALTYEDYNPLSILNIEGSLDVCIEIHSLSKAFNMTGWRLAFVVGCEKAMKIYCAVKGHTDSGQFRAIQKAGAYALDNCDLIEANKSRYYRRFLLLTKALKEIGFKAEIPKGGFYCYVPIPLGIKNGIRFNNAEEASLYILSKALVSTVPWDDCGSYLRFSVTFDAESEVDELNIINELKERLLSLNLEF
ncbi:LL-diaminopimelate aminotransferase [Paeniclostridium sordellii]|uniref:LL-diaminopimelate aminotransferase n=1 Tax=Paraclostridium sordellii TaxID=1505 RepID=UPI0005E20961|nr:LL-diaminopimelate aminotransferase [Paeniclostridium sordellii]MBX9182421.1 LL-diaminopimelate aminotransferase [Paeniclostridium sordellii]MDU4414529.1 LL-diaminopimelate aminotransferase [Paeniclostridium sordellii]MRZ27214.1 LL-diaminopimelate aminotransferase [Paeniclostridium sordellii]CEN97208.1 aspartate/tyrosine/aromatic aminotransferase [[Clostridium] sordellii] [Paeniclostridium sordellii]CEN97964.1 aspartate/tyrosine/aromatic aminotransferase [[Clostridium] sordellii] [Paeniclos